MRSGRKEGARPVGRVVPALLCLPAQDRDRRRAILYVDHSGKSSASGLRPDVEYLDPEATPLIETSGKATVIRELLSGRAGRSMLVQKENPRNLCRAGCYLAQSFRGF